MYRSKKELKKASGFTIIEVMIVLAVAGLIMAIVFLAVPALQRNARNSQRSADASRMLAAVGECLSAKNGQVSSCDVTTELDGFANTGQNQQLTTVNLTLAAPSAASIPTGTVDRIDIGYGAKCNSAGDALDTTGTTSPRSYAGLYRVEASGTDALRCVAS